MRFLGLISVLISFVLTGFYIRSVFRKRVELLEECVNMINIIESQINFVNSDVFTLLELLTCQTNIKHLEFVKCCYGLMTDGKSFDEAWNISLKSISYVLSIEDKNILFSFGSQIGKSDLQGQINNCRLHKERLICQLNKAEDNLSKYGKICIRLSFLGGLLFIIILI